MNEVVLDEDKTMEEEKAEKDTEVNSLIPSKFFYICMHSGLLPIHHYVFVNI